MHIVLIKEFCKAQYLHLTSLSYFSQHNVDFLFGIIKRCKSQKAYMYSVKCVIAFILLITFFRERFEI